MTQQEALEMVRKTSILEGVFDHHGDCRAPDYGECTCSKVADDNRIAELAIAVDSDARIDELRRMAPHTITDLRAYVNDRIRELEAGNG